MLNRFNVSLTSYGGYRDFSYFPSAIEIIITLALIAGGVLIFDFGTRICRCTSRSCRKNDLGA